MTLVMVNGPPGCIMANRARGLFGQDAEIVYKSAGRVGSIPAMARALRRSRDGTVYCIDIGFPAAPLAAFDRAISRHRRLVYEIGDPAGPLLAAQRRSVVEISAARWLDRWLPRAADKLVFRGSYLVEYFRDLVGSSRFPGALWLPDGVDCETFRPQRGDDSVRALRRRYGLDDKFVVGIVGSIHHNPTHDLVYGWELLEALSYLKDDRRFIGVVVGDGAGRVVLERRRAALGLDDRVLVVGRRPHAEIPSWINTFDVALSTQTDDAVGWGRTTAKLPEYLACGTPVLCSDVGEAHRWLSATGQTLTYRGFRDAEYPSRLAAQLVDMANADLEPLRRDNRALAERHFDYRRLREKLQHFLNMDDASQLTIGVDA
jgi:glycosyltransferase involved in cell wall biosynthesis